MSLIEKKILEAYLLKRRNKNREALELIEQYNADTTDYIKAHRHYITGILRWNLQEYNEGLTEIYRAYELFMKDDCVFFSFTCIYGLIFSALIHNKQHEAEAYLAQIIEDYSDYPECHSRIRHARFVYEAYFGDCDDVTKMLEGYDLVKEMENSTQAEGQRLCIGLIFFYVRTKQYELCYDVLEKLKTLRANISSSNNYDYIKKLLDHFVKNEPIYIYQAKYDDAPVFLRDLQIINALESQDLALAKSLWEENAKILPNLYLADFAFSDTNCLFYLCLQKHLRPDRPVVLATSFPDETLKIDRLYEVCQKLDGAIAKEKLYELVWGVPPQDKSDITKLARTVYRLKKKYNITLNTRKGAYILATPPEVSKK